MCVWVEFVCAWNKFPIHISRSYLIENSFHTCKSALCSCMFMCVCVWVSIRMLSILGNCGTFIRITSTTTTLCASHSFPFLSFHACEQWTSVRVRVRVSMIVSMDIVFLTMRACMCKCECEWALNIRVRNIIGDWQNDDVEQRWLLLPLLQLPFEFQFRANANQENWNSLMIN